MVSVTGSVTWISYGSSVIGKNPDSRRQQDEKHAHRYRPERTAGSGKGAGTTAKEDAAPLPGTAVRGRILRFTDRCGGKQTERVKNRSV